MGHTLKTVFWALLLVLMIIYSFGIAFTVGVSDELHASQDSPNFMELELFWGTLPRSMFTLFKSISGGVSWHQAVMPLSDAGWMYVALFVLYIMFSVFAVLNVVTGVFCQSAIENAQNDKDVATLASITNHDEMRQKLHDLFNEMDEDSSGLLTLDVLETTLLQRNSQAYLQSLGIDVTSAWNLLKLLDVNRDGTVDLEEFVLGCMALRGDAKAIHVAMLSHDLGDMMQMMEEFMTDAEKKLTRLVKTSNKLNPEPADDDAC